MKSPLLFGLFNFFDRYHRIIYLLGQSIILAICLLLSIDRLEIGYNKKMRILKYKWILVFFMLWLPVQGVAAAALSVCVQEDFRHHDKIMIAEDHHHEDCHKQMADTTDHLLASLPCDDTSCGAYSNTPILSGYSAPMATNDTSTITSFNPGFISFVPEQPQRPPLSTSL